MNRSEYPFLAIVKEGLILNVYVQPRSSKNQICGQQGEELKIRLTSPPVDGAANKLCREFMAELFGVSKSSVEIVSGETSRHKRVRILGERPDQLKSIIDAIIMSR